MTYFLFHKNVKVLSANFNSENNLFLDVIEIFNDKHIPIGLQTMPQTNFTKALNFWWQSRLIPKNRNYSHNINFNLSEYYKNSNGFNLSDQYWIKDENSQMTWEEGNFFQNDFDKDIGEYLITQNNHLLQNLKSNTPDLFSNGEQDKRWIIENNKRYLLKYGKPPYYQQPFNEKLVSEICKQLKINYVNYNCVVKNPEQPIFYSSCKCFIDENTEFVPAGFVQYAFKKEKGVSEYQHLINCCKKLKMPDIQNIENEFAKMNIVDYIVANVDRHYGNFGFIRDVKTLEWKGVAPIFDTGNSIFFDLPTSDLRKSTSLTENVISKSFSQTQKKQIIKFANQEALLDLNFSKLKDIDKYFQEILQQNLKIDKERRELLSNILLQRIEDVQRLIFFYNDITKNFLLDISKDNSSEDFFKKVVKAKNNVENLGLKENKVIENYLKNLKPISKEDFEEKLKIDINNISKSKQKLQKTYDRER